MPVLYCRRTAADLLGVSSSSKTARLGLVKMPLLRFVAVVLVKMEGVVLRAVCSAR